MIGLGLGWFGLDWIGLVWVRLDCIRIRLLFLFCFIGVELFNIPNLTFHLQLVYFIFVGSENNSLYLYYKGLSKQLLTFKFDTVRSVLVRSKIILL